jgi:hypothetical protein
MPIAIPVILIFSVCRSYSLDFNNFAIDFARINVYNGTRVLSALRGYLAEQANTSLKAVTCNLLAKLCLNPPSLKVQVSVSSLPSVSG